ncbi:stage II sporulation protein D [Clostridiisalibacter paucivorans]|uniref:stage II sporulation protein D n=1 Tax=Clostridiisalibacter paucivorans TaxID=408753 RepID=UPI0004797A8C|nr:stage II sporulation protein D [Clostridiisalibacter paucivorans]
MKTLGIYIFFLLCILIFLPIVLIKGCGMHKGDIEEEVPQQKESIEIVHIYDISQDKVIEMGFDEYIKGVVAAEMPANFHKEALKAQAVAARTYAMYRIEKYRGGHPDHPQAPLCNDVHCQAWLSRERLESLHSEDWIENLWPKIESAVDETSGQVITYNGMPIEPLFHSTSGGMTEDSEEVFAAKLPYLRSVSSPYEEGAPKLKGKIELSMNEFINRIKTFYPSIKINKSNIAEKIKLLERSDTGRIKKIQIDNSVLTGRDIRSIFKLNSTNFTISIFSDEDKIKIDTIGYGHGVGMSQWGANGMANKGSTYVDILKHYYTGVKIKKMY